MTDPAPIRSSARPLWRLLRYAHPFRGRVTWAATCSVLNKLFDLAPPFIIGAAIVGGTFSVRQVLLHIAPVPGEPTGYGSAVLGMHLYSWAAVVFLTAIAGTAGFLCVIEDEAPRTRRQPSGFERGALLFATLLCLANVVATFAECGLGPCCENGPCP